ncbi:hypothetical protein COY96_01405 [Candidatus Wolfebacteria bacterium CG_4_10_14_0_8_um_filter_37_11]|uniref:Uncharacterized protein n=1 Tax=Candidatus Wolfebacteria bacterium CG_4_10_14_0_8_um_filter_37_11 TaxID=1975062 RepID=A0A2M7Q8W7_9BACT|nr:MAG: hypothetical protein COY96_01405 [Candidatus Wolfebacteria bacterium CG_4_10_14_0_8_um_filter_37_11]
MGALFIIFNFIFYYISLLISAFGGLLLFLGDKFFYKCRPLKSFAFQPTKLWKHRINLIQ